MRDEDRLKDIQEFLKNENIAPDEVKEEENNEKTMQKQEKEEIEDISLSDFEKEQMSKGWNPKGEKSAEEWARTEPLYEEIKARGKEIKRMQRTIKAMQDHMQKQEKIAYDKALRDLESQRNNAIRNGDINLVQEIDKSKESLSSQFNDIEFMENTQEPEAVHDFKERHASWMNGTSYEEMNMQQWLLQRDSALASKQLPPDEHMKVLEDHLYKQFPDFFNKNKEDSNQYVESGSYDVDTSKQINKKVGFRDLSQSQKQIAKDFERMGVMSVDEYIKQLASLGELNKK